MNARKIIFFILIFFMFPTAFSYCQKLNEIESQIDSLLVFKSNLETLLDSVNMKIDELQDIKIKIQTTSDTTSGVLVALAYDGDLMSEPYPFSTTLKNCLKTQKY